MTIRGSTRGAKFFKPLRVEERLTEDAGALKRALDGRCPPEEIKEQLEKVHRELLEARNEIQDALKKISEKDARIRFQVREINQLQGEVEKFMRQPLVNRPQKSSQPLDRNVNQQDLIRKCRIALELPEGMMLERFFIEKGIK